MATTISTDEATFGQRIKDARTNLGLSRQGMADECDVTYEAVRRWEADENMPATLHLPHMARYLGIAPGILGDWIEYSPLYQRKEVFPLAVTCPAETPPCNSPPPGARPLLGTWSYDRRLVGGPNETRRSVRLPSLGGRHEGVAPQHQAQLLREGRPRRQMATA